MSAGAPRDGTRTPDPFDEMIAAIARRLVHVRPADSVLRPCSTRISIEVASYADAETRDDAAMADLADRILRRFLAYRDTHPKWQKPDTQKTERQANRDFAEYAIAAAFDEAGATDLAERARRFFDERREDEQAERTERRRRASAARQTLDCDAHVCRALQHAHMAAILSEDPCKKTAFEAAKIALLSLTGKRGADLPPLDFLEEHRRGLLGEAPPRSAEAEVLPAAVVRKLGEIVERYAFTGAGYRAPGRANAIGRLLRRDMVDYLGAAWERLDEATCASALRSWVRRTEPGRLTTAGVIRELARAAGFQVARLSPDLDPDERSRIERQMIDKAIRRGRESEKRTPTKRRKARRKRRVAHSVGE